MTTNIACSRLTATGAWSCCPTVGCLGGHERTGTALACLAVLTGHPALHAVAWVRSSYCTRAVETPEQEAFIVTLFNS
jgi:protein-tyrosine phosphatase